MTAGKQDGNSSPAIRVGINIYRDLRARNHRQAELARAIAERTRVERVLQAAREQRFHRQS